MVIEYYFNEDNAPLLYQRNATYYVKKVFDEVLSESENDDVICKIYHIIPLLQGKTLHHLIRSCLHDKTNISCYNSSTLVMTIENKNNLLNTNVEHEDFMILEDPMNYEEVFNILNNRTIQKLKMQGVFFISSKEVFIAPEVTIEKGTYIYPNVEIVGNSHIGENNFIGPHVFIANFSCGCYNLISWFVGKDSHIGNRNQLGPFLHFREKVILEDDNVIGNFNELKTVNMKSNNKMKHLSYFGNVTMGEHNNVGCGVITANYNGKRKASIQIEDETFIGCNSTLVAPLKLNKNAYVAAQSVITKDLQENEFAISRPELITKKRNRS